MQIRKSFFMVGIMFLTCILLSILGQFLPVTVISQNIIKSENSFSEKVSYPKEITNYRSAQLDDWTDAIILAIAGYDGNESVIDKSFANYREVKGDPCESLHAYIRGSTNLQKSDYARYWLGSIFFVKLLLLFLDYPGIQMFNQIMQIVLLVFLAVLMERKRLTRYIIPLVISLLWLMPGTVYLSIQFSVVYYITLISMILVLMLYGTEKCHGILEASFICLGGVTNWLDFLTYPLTAFGMPLLMLMILMDEEKRGLGSVKVLKFALCWTVGYSGMWILKWCLATVVLHQNIFENALNHARYRTAQTINDVYHSRVEVLIVNLRVMLKKPYFFGILVSSLYCVKQALPVKRIKPDQILPYLLVLLMPFAWYMVMFNHSWIHYWFTYRTLCISVFASQCILLRLQGAVEGGGS